MQDRERVLSALSHDMKNLVGAVDMNLQLIPLVLQSPKTSAGSLGGASNDVPVGEFIERAHQAALGIGSLVDDVVAWFRLGDGRGVVFDDRDSAVTLSQISALIRAEFTPQLRTQQLIFHLEMDGDGPTKIKGGAVALRVLRLVMQHCLRFLFPQQKLMVRIGALQNGAFAFSIETDQEALFDGQAQSLALLLAEDFAGISGGSWGRSDFGQNGEKMSVRWM